MNYVYQNKRKICIATFCILWPSIIYPNWDFWS
jgi:hypothetical protein